MKRCQPALQIIATVSLSVTIAMYCLIQLYVVVSEHLKPHQPLLKLFSLKAVGEYPSSHLPQIPCSQMVTVFLTFWQATGLSFLVTLGLIKDVSVAFELLVFPFLDRNVQTEYMTAENISIGIGAILECLEMA